MKNALAAFAVGFLFAIGLGVSGMTQPQKVVGFLDILGNWDPSLMFVMVGAIGFHAIAYAVTRKRNKPLLADAFQVPTKTDLTPALKVGAVLFGVGWGLGGFCPGPAVASLASLDNRPLVFVGFMLLGMFLFRLVDKKYKFVK